MYYVKHFPLFKLETTSVKYFNFSSYDKSSLEIVEFPTMAFVIITETPLK